MSSGKAVRKTSWGVRSRKAMQLLGGIFAALLLCVPAYSQGGTTGRILGTIFDQSGGVVAGATVTVADVDRGVSRTLTSSDAGEYSAPDLLPGNYTVRATAKGFRTTERQNIVLEVGKEPRVDLTLQPGDVAQTITITEQLPLVETTNATMGGTLENADIVDLPLNGRDYQNLLALRPGVQLYPGGGPWTQSSNNLRPDETVWMVEGVLNTNPFDARPVANMPSPFTDGAVILPVDAIQEFNTMENPKAEYGWKPGAVVNVGLKSGTNTLHGSAYAFGRTTGWDARNYYNVAPVNGNCLIGPPASLCNQLPVQLKQFGGTAGGPIKKDKLFWFAGYEGLRDSIQIPYTISLPQLGSGGAGAANGANFMVDAINCLGAPSAATCGAGNPTPTAPVALSTVSLKMLCPNAVGQALPLPTTFLCTGGLLPQTNGLFLSAFPNVNQSDNGVGKLDYHLNDKNQIFGSLYVGNYISTGEDRPFTNVAFTDNAPIRVWSNNITWIYTPSSNVVNEMRFGYDQVSFQFYPLDLQTPANGVGYPLNTGVTNPGGLPSIDIGSFKGGGADTLGTAGNRPQGNTPNPFFDYQESVSVLRGKHAFKFGAEFAHMEADADIFNDGRGLVGFKGGQAFNFGAGDASSGLEDFFAGQPTSASLEIGDPHRTATFMSAAGYLQDDWHITNKLMLNLGMRYEYVTPMSMQNALWASFEPGLGLVQQGFDGLSSLWKPDHRGFEPRAGFAYDVTGKGTTVVRAGFSILRTTWPLDTFVAAFGLQNNTATSPLNNPTEATFLCNPGFGGAGGETATGCASPGGTNALGVASYGPGQLCWDAPPVGTGVNCGAHGQATVFPHTGLTCGDGITSVSNPTGAGPCPVFSIDPNLRVPYVVNYNVSVQHQIGNDLSVEVAYVGNRGYELLNFYDQNQAPLGSAWCMNTLTPAQSAIGGACQGGALTEAAALAAGPSSAAVQQARPFFSQYPYLSFINSVANNARSNYNSLQVTITKRMSHGLSFTTGYTYGHGLDNGSLNRFGGLPQNSQDPNAEYGSSDFDVRNRLTITGTYNIPGKKGYGQLLDGWQINSIYSYSTPMPWIAFDQNGDNISGDGEVGSNGNSPDRWDIVGSPLDFPVGTNSNPFCVGGSCTTTTPYGPVTTAETAAQTALCTADAPDPQTLAAFGCYPSTNGKSAIVPPHLGQFGNMGRNIFRDYGFQDWDMSIFKNFKFRERFGIQARWEVFNVLNRPVPGNPYGGASFVNAGNGLGAPGLGAPGATNDILAGNPLIGSGSNRAMQVGLKITF